MIFFSKTIPLPVLFYLKHWFYLHMNIRGSEEYKTARILFPLLFNLAVALK
jgi:hypothetical protein